MVANLQGLQPIADPQEYLRKRKAEIDRVASSQITDPKELEDRQEAAQAYSGENEKHFVDYVEDCIKTSRDSMRDVRGTWQTCYDAYCENEPITYGDKEDWQARIVVPRPFQTVQYGASAVKRAFTPQFLTIEKAQNKASKEFWQKIFDIQLDKQHANFLLRFTDATTMALAVGQSLEMIPRWNPEFKRLQFDLVEPWKIFRDPDALPRDPQSGMYWIHQEWLDFFVLKQGEEDGKYFEVERAKTVSGTTDQEDPFMTAEAVEARKGQIWSREGSKYRQMILTSEFYGMILDPKGNMLLPNATLTIAGGRVIEKPRTVPFRRIRWPGVSWSPLPDLLKFGGRGLLKGVVSIWNAMNQIGCLHQDNLVWVVNPMTEINTDLLVDPKDVNTWPGKEYLTREGAHGQSAVKNVERQSRTNEVIANMQHYDQFFQRGSFVPDNIQGAPGWRQDVTLGEASMNLNQALSVYSLMGQNIEDGAIWAVIAGLEFIERYAVLEDYMTMFTEEELATLEIKLEPDADGRVLPPKLDGRLHISGIESLMKEQEALQNLKEVVIPLADHPKFGPYIYPYKVLKSIELRTNLTDENVIATEDEAKLIDKQMQLAQLQQQDAAQKMMDLQEALGITELLQKIDELTDESKAKAEKKTAPVVKGE